MAASRYYEPRVSDGTDKALVSIGEQYDEASAPGLSAQPNYLRTIAFVEIDSRQPLNARKGGWYRAELSHYDDRDLSAYPSLAWTWTCGSTSASSRSGAC